MLAFTIVIYLLNTTPRAKKARPAVVEKPVSLSELRSALNTALLLMLILVLLWGIPWGTVITYLVSAWGIEKAQASLLLVISAISIVIGHVLGGTLADCGVKRGDRLARVKLSIISVAVGLAVMLSFVLYPYPYGSRAMIHLTPPLFLGGLVCCLRLSHIQT